MEDPVPDRLIHAHAYIYIYDPIYPAIKKKEIALFIIICFFKTIIIGLKLFKTTIIVQVEALQEWEALKHREERGKHFS